MEGIIIILALVWVGLYSAKQHQDDEYEAFKEDWRIHSCPKNKHFVGKTDGVCDICGEHAIMLKNGGWKWHKK